MFVTETVTVCVPGESTETDPFGAPMPAVPACMDISGVLVAPGPTADLDASRPDGVTVAFTLHFPKSFVGVLRGAMVTVRGADYQVVGDPASYTPENTPGRWNMPVEVKRVGG